MGKKRREKKESQAAPPSGPFAPELEGPKLGRVSPVDILGASCRGPPPFPSMQGIWVPCPLVSVWLVPEAIMEMTAVGGLGVFTFSKIFNEGTW